MEFCASVSGWIRNVRDLPEVAAVVVTVCHSPCQGVSVFVQPPRTPIQRGGQLEIQYSSRRFGRRHRVRVSEFDFNLTNVPGLIPFDSGIPIPRSRVPKYRQINPLAGSRLFCSPTSMANEKRTQKQRS